LPARVYSERFLSVSQGGAWTYYAVPYGYRAVIRCITVVVFGGTNAAVYVAAGPTYLTAKPYPANTALVLGDYRVPVYGGETIGCQVSGADTFCTVSGYLFTDDGARAEFLPAHEENPPPWPEPPPFGPDDDP